LAELIISFLDLLEVEGRTLRRWAMRVGVGLALVVVSAVLGLAALGFCLWSAYLYFDTMLGTPMGALATGALTFLIAGGLLWTALRLSR
jgi:hypothetical protein